MRHLPLILAACALAATVRAADAPALPAWHGNERADLKAKGWVPGGILLSPDFAPDEPARPAAAPLPLDPPKPGEIDPEAKPGPEIPGKFLAPYFAKRPTSFLVDPQSLLDPVTYRDRLKFLSYHASDSTIDLFAYLIPGDQEIPGEVREEEISERFFATGRPAVIVFYYMGAPQRSAVYLSPSLTGSVSTVEQRRALESSVQQAFAKTDPSEQLERFLVQMSIRIYWMEQQLHPAAAPVATAPVPAVAETAVHLSAKMMWVKEIASHCAIPAAVVLAALVSGWVVIRLLRLRARYRFPEFGIEPRLGGPHAAGIGAVISFASASLPPASQRHQVPDYFRHR